jgi:hypothetical protein
LDLSPTRFLVAMPDNALCCGKVCRFTKRLGEQQCSSTVATAIQIFLMNVLGVFAFVVWFWLLIVIYGDLFRRHDISGWGKAVWVLALVLTSYFGILVYLITQGAGMAERNAQQAAQARDD